jgi:hypothetical protein
MIDIKADVYQALQGISPQVPVFHSWPEDWSVLPPVSFHETANQVELRTNDMERFARISITVDVWGETPESVSDVAMQVDSLLSGVGLVRGAAVDLYETVARRHHKAMIFSGVVDVITRTVYRP